MTRYLPAVRVSSPAVRTGDFAFLASKKLVASQVIEGYGRSSSNRRRFRRRTRPSETQLAAEFYDRTAAALFGIPSTEFGPILYAIARKYLPGVLQVNGNFALHCASTIWFSRAGALQEAKKLGKSFSHAFARSFTRWPGIAREPSAAQDMSDSLYGDLYGLTSSDSIRASKLISYTGRGSLEGWLRTVLAQEFINRYRKNKRLVSLDETDSDEDGSHRHVPELVAPENNPPVSPDARLVKATDETLAALPRG